MQSKEGKIKQTTNKQEAKGEKKLAKKKPSKNMYIKKETKVKRKKNKVLQI